MSLLQRPTQRRKPPRRDPAYRPPVTYATATNSLVSTKWRLVFNVPVMVKSLPTASTVNGGAPTAVTQDSPTQITLTFAVAVAAEQTWVIPLNSKNIRTATGGFVANATGTF